MTGMSMNKVIHAAVRRDLARFVAALQSFAPGDAARARQLGDAWANFDAQLTEHHEGEHRIAWPALREVGVSDELIATFDAEHETMAAALGHAGDAIGALTRSPGESEAAAALSAFVDLETVTVRHLDHEEAEVEPVYQANRDAPAIKAMGRAFGRVDPRQGGQFFAWVLDGITPEAKAALDRDVPRPVLGILNGVFGRSYRAKVAPVWRT
jgi:hemerythrin-like domain-containing protein